ncbi:MAG: hypothetical protein GXP23_12735 [Gammaproteobacteria bacterium]|nr:hypothetical protein [Gammaproteobacteria bacterium]
MQATHPYNKYTITNVYGTATPDQQQRILDFWRRNNAIGNLQEAQQRVHQVVLIAEDEGKQVVGVSTAYIQQYQGDMKNYFFYRMFIEPGSRVYGMMEFMTQMTHESLKNFNMPDKPEGMIVITENPKLMRKGMRRMLARSGLEYIGKDNSQQDTWYWGFDKPSLPGRK